MKTKTILKTLAVALLMPAMLLTTACSNEDDLTNNTVNSQPVANKGYALPVTVSATRSGDATRATFDGSKLNFGTGDKLFVYGSATAAGSFAGELDYVPATGKFSGTIYTQEEWTGTPDALFTAASAGENLTATLLPNGYDANSFLSINNNSTPDIAYDDRVTVSGSYAFVASETAKATGVEQLSLERTSTYSSGFALSPENAILNFTITGLEAGAKNVLLKIHHGFDYDVTGSVTPNASGVATFAIGVPVGANIKEMSNNLTVGSSNFTLPSSTTFAAGHIYNISRSVAAAPAVPTGALSGKFSVSATKQVYFSKGNLQYIGSAATPYWQFAEHQYDYLGTTTSQNSDATNVDRDLFGWGTSGKTFDSGYGSYYQPYDTNNTKTEYGPTGEYNLTGDYADGDWGVNMGTGWRTLTGGSGGEWEYLFNTRTVNGGTGEGKSYTLGQSVNGVLGVVLYPDDFTGSTYSGSNWADFENAGCVFLPAAGFRNGTLVTGVGSYPYGYYWSSTAKDAGIAYTMYFGSGNVNPASNGNRSQGFSVRLVHDAN